jgi:hypothetical protein
VSALKRLAHLQAALASAPPPPPPPPPRPALAGDAPFKRDIVIHLTPFAPGCEHMHAGDQKRTLVYYNRRPGQALDALCKRLEIGPKAIALAAVGLTEVAIHPHGRPDAPWAFVWDGLTLNEAQQALDALIALRGDRP